MSSHKKDGKMADGLVVLGTVGIVGLVAVTTVSLVYNRTLWVRGSRSDIQVHTGRSIGAHSANNASIENASQADANK